MGMSAAFWACGDGSIEALNSDDDVALVNYGEFNPEAMRTLVSGATEACTADPECAAKMESAVDVPPPEQAPADSGATPGSSGAADTPANSSPSTTPTSSPAGTSSSGTSPNTNPTVSSSSTAPNTNPTVSSSSAQQQQTQSSSSAQQQTQPSSASQSSASSGGDGGEIAIAQNTVLEKGKTYTITGCTGPGSNIQLNNVPFGDCLSIFGEGGTYWYNNANNCGGAISVSFPVTVTIPSSADLTIGYCGN